MTRDASSPRCTLTGGTIHDPANDREPGRKQADVGADRPPRSLGRGGLAGGGVSVTVAGPVNRRQVGARPVTVGRHPPDSNRGPGPAGAVVQGGCHESPEVAIDVVPAGTAA